MRKRTQQRVAGARGGNMNISDPYILPTIEFVGGSTQEQIFAFFSKSTKKPFDISFCTADFSIINYVNKNGCPLVSKDMKVDTMVDSGEEIQNVLRVVLDPEDTVNLVGKYIYQITIKDISRKVEIPGQGIILIRKNIHPRYIG